MKKKIDKNGKEYIQISRFEHFVLRHAIAPLLAFASLFTDRIEVRHIDTSDWENDE